MNAVRVLVRAADPLVHLGIRNLVATGRNTSAAAEDGPVDVVVLVAERLSVQTVSSLRALHRTLGAPVVLVVTEIGYGDLFAAAECGVMAVLPRASATAERIEAAVLAAAGGGGMLPEKLVGELIRQVGRIQRDAHAPHGLTPREIDVLRMMSDGLSTTEIAGRLCLSERAVKRVVFGVTTRLKLRNRPHAVAYALRMGLI